MSEASNPASEPAGGLPTGDGEGLEQDAGRTQSSDKPSSSPGSEKVRVRDLWHDRDCAIFAGSSSCSCGAVAQAVKDASRP